MFKLIKELKESLGKYLKIHGRRKDLIARILIALMQVKTVNLSEIAKAMPGKSATVESKYRRLQRFFKEFEVVQEQVAQMILSAGGSEKPVVLIMDRTTWEYGSRTINLLLLAVSIKGVAIPVLSEVVEGKGNSETALRQKLLERFIETFGRHRIAYLTGDREFIGREWFNWLQEQGIEFRLRIKKNALITYHNRTRRAEAWFKSAKPRYLKGVQVYGCQMNLAGQLLDKGELLLIVGTGEPNSFFDDYALRWQIETLFKCLKSGGFNLEDTHLRDPHRVNKFIPLLSMAFLWAYKTGLWQHQFHPIPFKKTLNCPVKNFSLWIRPHSECILSIGGRFSKVAFSSLFS